MDPMEITGYLTHGRSTVILAQALRDSGRLLLAIDPHEGVLNGVDGRSMMAVEPTLAALRSNLDRFGVADLVQVHVGTVDDAPLPALIALAFVDGLHVMPRLSCRRWRRAACSCCTTTMRNGPA